MSSSGGHNQFFKVVGNTLKWTDKESGINKVKGIKIFKFTDIKAIVYGNQSKTF